MPAFAEKFTEAQREACAVAFETLSAPRVLALAAAGELEHDGVRLEPFEVAASTVRDFARKRRRRKTAGVPSALEVVPPRDAVEVLRRRLVTMADEMAAEMQGRRPKDRDPERLRQIIRCVFEASKLPGPADPRPPSTDTRDATGRKGPRTTGGLAGPLIQAHRASAGGSTIAPEPPVS